MSATLTMCGQQLQSTGLPSGFNVNSISYDHFIMNESFPHFPPHFNFDMIPIQIISLIQLASQVRSYMA